MSEPINYRIAIDFTTNRPLTLDELIVLGGQAWTQVHEPADDEEESDPFETIGVELSLYVGEDEVGGLNPKPVHHAHVAYYQYFEEGNPGHTMQEASDVDWYCFADEAEAEATAERWLAAGAWSSTARVNVGVRIIVVPEWVSLYLQSSETSDEDDATWADWSQDEVWNIERRVGERMRVWLAS